MKSKGNKSMINCKGACRTLVDTFAHYILNSSEGSNVANFTTEPSPLNVFQSTYVLEPKRSKREDETADEELRQLPAKKNQEFKKKLEDQEFKEEFKDQELKELEQEQQLLGKWLETKTKEALIIQSLYDHKTKMLDQKKRKLQYVNKINVLYS